MIRPSLRHAGMPLVRFVEAQAGDVAAVGRHVVQRVGGADAAAAQVAAAALADERDPAVGQPAGIEVVPRAVGQLLQARAVDVDLEDVVAAAFVPVALRRIGVVPVPRVAAGTRRRRTGSCGRRTTGRATGTSRRRVSGPWTVAAAVERQRRRTWSGRRDSFWPFSRPRWTTDVGQHVADLRVRAERVGQHVQPAAGRGGHAVVLVAHVVVQRPVPLDEQDLVEVQQRVGQGDLAAHAARLFVQLVPGVGLVDRDAGRRPLAVPATAARSPPGSGPPACSSGRPAAPRYAAARCPADRGRCPG